MPILAALDICPAVGTLPIPGNGRGETGAAEDVATHCRGQEGAGLDDLGKAVQADGAVGVQTSGGGGGRLCQVHHVLTIPVGSSSRSRGLLKNVTMLRSDF